MIIYNYDNCYNPFDEVFYYHNDHLGTPLAMTDESGNVVWKASYTPFGEAVVDPSSSVTNNFRFPGQYYDSESGLHYNYHRYYDPKTGRYLRADPIGIQGGMNHLYVYVQNNPVNLMDLFGLLSCDGRWGRRGWHRDFNMACTCYWLCVPCDGPVIWGGDYWNLPKTHGIVKFTGGGGLESGDDCLCPKPGSEKECDECE